MVRCRATESTVPLSEKPRRTPIVSCARVRDARFAMTTTTDSPTSLTPDYTAIKGRQKQTWASGDYHVIASIIVPIAEQLCDAVGLRAGEAVLDVATGSGNAAIAAARR